MSLLHKEEASKTINSDGDRAPSRMMGAAAAMADTQLLSSQQPYIYIYIQCLFSKPQAPAPVCNLGATTCWELRMQREIACCHQSQQPTSGSVYTLGSYPQKYHQDSRFPDLENNDRSSCSPYTCSGFDEKCLLWHIYLNWSPVGS